MCGARYFAQALNLSQLSDLLKLDKACEYGEGG